MSETIKRGITYTVGEGENLITIAKAFGFRRWETIYNHQKNANFRKENPSPYIVKEKSKLWIPEFTIKQLPCETGKTHRFILERLKTLLHIELKDDEGQPYANIKYEVWVPNKKTGNMKLYGSERRTTAQGFVDAEVPVIQTVDGQGEESYAVDLKLWFDGDDAQPETYTVQIGELDPIDTIEGIQDRLNNLGYDSGAVDGELGPITKAALEKFQADYGLPVTGKIDKATRNKLKAVHDNV